jgi:cytidylate kinase
MATIITVSRQFGSGGARIGRALAQRLGLRYADRDILAEAARRLNVDEGLLEPFEERIASLWDRVGMLFALGAPDTPYVPPALPSVSEARLFDVEREVILSIAAHGGAVIVGRGAAHLLRDSPDLVRIFLHAPFAWRLDLAMREYGFTDREKTEQIVRESDRGRSKFVRNLTGRDWCDAALYELSLDTSVVGLDGAVDLVLTFLDCRARARAAAGETAAPQGR